MNTYKIPNEEISSWFEAAPPVGVYFSDKLAMGHIGYLDGYRVDHNNGIIHAQVLYESRMSEIQFFPIANFISDINAGAITILEPS